MGLPTYLSVDLDYWDLAKTPYEAINMFRKLLGLGVPLSIVEQHDGLLEFANESGALKLINVDYHSDFANYVSDEKLAEAIPNCGTWVDFVEGLQEFEWRYPSRYKCFRLREGRCEYFTCSNKRSSGGFWTTGRTTRGLRVSHTPGIKYLPYKNIVAAGVALSLGYWNNDMVEQDIMDFLAANSAKFTYIEPFVKRAWTMAA
jgi:hypothetical protein